MRNKAQRKYNGMNLARDWIGKRVATAHDMRNGVAQLPAGSLGEITGQSTTGLTFKSDRCECCGVQIIISHLNYHDVNLAKL